MIQVPPNANGLVMHEPISFRNGIDGTAGIARVVLEKEPMDGAFFVFRPPQQNLWVLRHAKRASRSVNHGVPRAPTGSRFRIRSRPQRGESAWHSHARQADLSPPLPFGALPATSTSEREAGLAVYGLPRLADRQPAWSVLKSDAPRRGVELGW